MAVVPCGHRLLVKPYKQEDVDPVLMKSREFLKNFEIVNSNKEREDKSVDKGVVLAIGPTAWQDFKSEPWCKVGDIIIFAKFSPSFITDPETNEMVGVLNDADVIAVLKGEVK